MAMCIRRQIGGSYPHVYSMQHGGTIFPHVYSMQSGGGLFSSLARFILPAIKSVARTVAPAVKTVAKTAAKDLLTAGVSTGLEALQGHDPAESAKRNLKRAAVHTLENTATQFLQPKKKKSINRPRRPTSRRPGKGKYAF